MDIDSWTELWIAQSREWPAGIQDRGMALSGVVMELWSWLNVKVMAHLLAVASVETEIEDGVAGNHLKRTDAGGCEARIVLLLLHDVFCQKLLNLNNIGALLEFSLQRDWIA